MTTLFERRFDAEHRAKLAKAASNRTVSAAVKAKISKSMAGKKNFKGKQHTERTKQEIGNSRGHDDRVQGRKWKINKSSGKTYRQYSLGNTDTYKWGRVKSFEEYVADL